MPKKKTEKNTPEVVHGNPNVPVIKYMTHPNQYFEIGDQVIPRDPEQPQVTGRVIGHQAEDRLLVEWARGIIDQVDVDDIIKMDEWSFGFAGAKNPKWATPHPESPSPYGLAASRTADGREALFGLSQAEKAKKNRQQYTQAGGNPFKFPGVAQLLTKAGMAPQEIKLYQNHYDRHLGALKSQGGNTPENAAQGGPQYGKQTVDPRRDQQWIQETIKRQTPPQIPADNPDRHTQPQVQQPAVQSAPQTDYSAMKPFGNPQQTTRREPWRSQKIRPASLSKNRRKAISNLLRCAAFLDSQDQVKLGNVVRIAASVATALNTLYNNPKTRKASSDDVAINAMNTAITATLGITGVLQASQLPHYVNIGKAVDLALLNALSYAR